MNKLNIDYYKKNGFPVPSSDEVFTPKPQFQHGTSTSQELDKMLKTVFMPDSRGIVSSAAGLSMAASNPALRDFYQELNRELPPMSGFSDDAKNTDLTVIPDGVMTPYKRQQYADRLKKFVELNAVRPKPKTE